MLRLIFLVIACVVAYTSIYAQPGGTVICEGDKYKNKGEQVEEPFEIYLDTLLLEKLVVKEDGNEYSFIFRSMKVLNTSKKTQTIHFDAVMQDDPYFLTLTMEKRKKKCLLSIFNGTSREWHRYDQAVRQYGFR